MPSERTDTVVVGAGVVGLAVARGLANKGREVIVLEANSAIGQEISSRNSEVIHPGIYYPPESLKAKCCVRGKDLLYRYCESRGIPHKRLGKLIVATGKEQVVQLEQLKSNADQCGVNDLELINRQQLAKLEPAVEAEAALLSPSTGIVDSHALMLAFQADIEAAGGSVVTNSRLAGGYPDQDGIHLQVISGGETWLRASLVINAAGLSASHVARSIPDIPEKWIPRTWYVKGHYFSYSGQSPFSQLIYPLPDKYSLGIHAALDLAMQLRFGPDAQYCEGIDYSFIDGRKDHFVRSIRSWFPDLQEDKLQPGYVGIRPKLAAPDEDFRDFEISGPSHHGIPGLVNLFGIESPGLTSCLALADLVVDSFR